MGEKTDGFLVKDMGDEFDDGHSGIENIFLPWYRGQLEEYDKEYSCSHVR